MCYIMEVFKDTHFVAFLSTEAHENHSFHVFPSHPAHLEYTQSLKDLPTVVRLQLCAKVATKMVDVPYKPIAQRDN